MQDLNERFFKIDENKIDLHELGLHALEVDEDIEYNNAQNYFDSV